MVLIEIFESPTSVGCHPSSSRVRVLEAGASSARRSAIQVKWAPASSGEPDSRGRLERAAMDLYGEHGFENTTVAEIAARAGLTERTFFRYFADKREVLFWGSGALQEPLVSAVVATPVAASPMGARLRPGRRVGPTGRPGPGGGADRRGGNRGSSGSRSNGGLTRAINETSRSSYGIRWRC